MEMDRTQVLNLFLMQQAALHSELLAVYTSYVLQIRIDGRPYRTVVLVRSSDYWHKRINLQHQRPDLIIAYQHDTCAPCAVLALDEGYLYEPCEPPRWYTPEKRFTARGHMVLLGQLLSGVDAGYRQLETLPRSTRFRYLAKMKRFTSQKQGRPMVA